MATASYSRLAKAGCRASERRGGSRYVSPRSCFAKQATFGSRAIRSWPARRTSRPSAAAVEAGSKADATEPSPEVELKSELTGSHGTTKAGVDYSTLRDCLASGQWEEADNETRRLLIVLAGSDAQKRGWVYFTEVNNISPVDLGTMDKLWVVYSKGNYGYSVQRKIWVQCKKEWGPFFKKIDWTTGENSAYRKWPEGFLWKADAAKGHLPLTNALRGTQLITAIFNHPAIAVAPEAKSESKQPKKLFNF